MKNVRRATKVFLGILGVGCVCAAAFVIIQIIMAPNLASVDASPSGYLSVVLDKDGKEIDTLSQAESNRIYVDMERIPEHLSQAVIAIEDSRFYRHHGIDLQGIARAAWHGISTRDFSQGASTLTQQLLKNNVLTSWTSEKTFYDKVCRKIQEQYLALRLERKYSKEWILENYLNTINLGGGTRGVQVASMYYFGKDVSELTLPESALIAGITKNPTKYNPFKNPEESLKRQGLVLDAMLKNGYITEAEYEEAKAVDVLAGLDNDHEKNANKVFSWFEDALYNQIVDDLKEKYNCSEKEAWDMLYSGGLTIYSTEDASLQNICQKKASDSSRYEDGVEVSLVMMEPETGAVLAIVGGNEKKKASLEYNRATESIRQPGSSIKIIGEYAAAMENGSITLGSVVDDEPYSYSDGTKLKNANGKNKGRMTIRDAIVSSNNIVALKTFQQLGVDAVYEQIKAFGITTLTTEDKNEALSIGGSYNGVTNLEMTAAYNCLANKGIYNSPHFYTKVINHDGEVILEYQPENRQVVSKETADLLTSAMEDVLTQGTGSAAYFSGVDIAGKSGTTNDNKDVWFLGYSLYYTCGVWGGKDDYSSQSDTSYVKELWRDIMEKANEDKADSALFEKDQYEKATICIKCGNRAVNGLCNETLQGDMVRTEFYKAGTAPMTECSCHVSYSICADSGKLSGSFCPSNSVTKHVYLVEGTAGTEDEEYVAGNMPTESCDAHPYPWSSWFHNGQENDQNNDQNNEQYNDPNNGQYNDSYNNENDNHYEDQNGDSYNNGDQNGYSNGESIIDHISNIFGW